MRGIDSHRYAVREKDLIGKALFIFWPHGVPFLNGGDGFAVKNHAVSDADYKFVGKKELEADANYPLYQAPFYPNIFRMKKIR